MLAEVLCSARGMAYRECEILHHVAHTAQGCHGLLGALPALGQEILDAAVGVDLHGAQVGEAVDQACILAEFLVEGVAEVVCGVGGDEEDGFAVFGELDGERARGCGLADTALAADEDPAQRLLVEDGLERRLHEVLVVEHCRGGHGDVLLGLGLGLQDRARWCRLALVGLTGLAVSAGAWRVREASEEWALGRAQGAAGDELGEGKVRVLPGADRVHGR